MVTEDFRPGRINAVSEAGVITSYTVEGAEQGGAVTPPPTPSGPHDVIIGMTEDEVAAYAATNNLKVRVGFRDGEPLPVTMDYRPGHITYEVEGGIVVGYSVE
jgi:hypothetical protein